MQNGVFLNNIKYLSSKEAGDYSGYTHDYISRLCRSGKIPGTKVGKVWFVEAESFQKFLENHGDHKNEVCQNLSKERKEEYQDSLEEKEVKELSQFSLPKITIPKYISQEVFAVSLSVLVVFGTYLVKDEPFVYATFENSKERVSAQLVSTQENLKNFKNGIHDGLEDSSQKMIASVFEVTSEESIDNFKSSSKEFLTYENLFNTTVHLITGTRDGINNSLASYLEFINTAGDVIVATSYKVLDFERGFSFNDLRFKDTVDVIALSKESVSKAVDAVKNKSIGVYGNAISNVSNIQSAVKDVPNNLSAVSFSTIPNFFEGIAEGARTRIASWLKFGESEESPQEEKEIVQTVINQPVIERVVETERVVVTSGITEEDVTLGLEQLNNKLSAEIYRLSDINAGNIINNYNVISHTNKIDTLKSVAITSSTFVDGTISGSTSFSGTTGSFSGAVSVASLAVSGDTALAGSLSLGGLTVDTAGLVYASSSKNVGIGTSTPYAKLSVVGQVVGEYFTATSTTATSTFSGGLLATRAPTTPHTFSSWTTGATNSALFDAAFVVNPASAVSDSNLISAGVGGSVRFLVDAEGDVFVNNLTSVGSVTLSTTSASTFTVEGNTTLGDSISDTTVINGTLTVTGATSVSTTDGNFGVGTTSPWARLSVSGTSNDSTTPLLSISTSTASATSTAIQVDANGKFGIGTSTPSEQLSVEGNALINGTLTSGALTTTGALTGTHVTANSTSATSTFAGGLAVETSGLVYDYSTNRVGIGTASPAVSLHINGTDGIIIPVGTTAQRPTGQTGTLRYNTTSSTFEGYNGSTWSGLGGVIDVDQDTYILAESSSGADEDVLFFFTGGSEKARLTTAGNFGIG
ncbi:MAG: helix-turn-helix domain-containing protein, partial [Candidatus Paceibacterota bacterium]